MHPIDSKLPTVGTTIFTVMSILAEEHDAINLSQGFPDFQPPGELIELVVASLRGGRNQYAPMIGVEELRVAVADLLKRRYAVHADAQTEITITSGATQALFAAIHAIVRPEDDVIIFDPAYDSYEPAVTLAGGRTIRLPMSPPGFEIDWNRLSESLSDRTRLVIINSPHNPTGSLLRQSDLSRLAEILRPFPCYVLSDEVYEHIVFDGEAHASVLQEPELAQKSFAISSFGKTFHATGWKIGYCVAPPALTEEFRKVHQFLMFATTTPAQFALAAYLTAHPEHFETLASFYQEKRDFFAKLLERSRFDLLPARGTYFQLADYAKISDEADVAFARTLTVQYGVATIPISVFYRSPPSESRLVRFCFAKENSTLRDAAQRLAGL
jgi:methionine aminotransferase